MYAVLHAFKYDMRIRKVSFMFVYDKSIRGLVGIARSCSYTIDTRNDADCCVYMYMDIKFCAYITLLTFMFIDS